MSPERGSFRPTGKLGLRAIIRSLSRKSASAIVRGAVGLASIITAHYASRSTDSWCPKGRRFPPRDLVAPLNSKCLPYPVVTDPEAPPLRPQRHVPNSIATLHRRVVYAIAQALLPRCPVCARNFPRNSRRNM